MEEFAKVLDRLQTQCVKREYCRSDIFRKAMTALEGDKDTAERLVASLVEDRFVDDSRYAAAFAREKARLAGWGPVKISFALAAKGISKDVASKALREVEPEEADRRMLSVLETKYRSLKGDPQEKFKLIKFGLTRGYEYEKIAPVVDEILKKNS
ncbi:MAG TPA: RecX family transcriptional regulator [Rikenellaceae bacterium]|nr:RecX family transcriptional regulator [Rikenellaceae bacterium]